MRIVIDIPDATASEAALSLGVSPNHLNPAVEVLMEVNRQVSKGLGYAPDLNRINLRNGNGTTVGTFTIEG